MILFKNMYFFVCYYELAADELYFEVQFVYVSNQGLFKKKIEGLFFSRKILT